MPTRVIMPNLGLMQSVDLNSTNGTNTDNMFIFQVALYCSIGIIGFLGNVFVIVVIILTPGMRSKITNRFLINQSVIDATASFWIIFNSALSFKRGEDSFYSGMVGELECRVISSGYILWSFYMASTYNLVVITVERYFGIVHAVFHKNHFNKRLVTVLMILPWILSFIFNSTGMILTKVVDKKCSQFEFDTDWEGMLFGWGTFIFQFLVPIIIMVFCYSKMAIYLMKHYASRSLNRERKKSKTTTNIVKTLTIVSITFILCWVWNSFFFLLGNMGVKVNFQTTFYHFTVIAVNVNCIANPFIYASKYEQFKEGIQKLFCKQQSLAQIEPETGGLDEEDEEEESSTV